MFLMLSLQKVVNQMPADHVTTNANEYIYCTSTYIPTGEYTFVDGTGWEYDRNYRLTPEALDELVDRINRVRPINNLRWDESQTATTCTTTEPQEEEEFDTTKIEEYIDSLEKEVVGTEN